MEAEALEHSLSCESGKSGSDIEHELNSSEVSSGETEPAKAKLTLNTDEAILLFFMKGLVTDDVVQIQRERCAILEANLGKEHIDTIQGQRTLALILGNTEERLKVQRDVVESLNKIYGKNHIDTMIALFKLGLVLLGMNTCTNENMTEALRSFETVYEFRKRDLGEGNANTLNVLAFIGTIHEMMGRQEEALTAFTKIYQHEDTLGAKQDLARVMISSGKWDEGEALTMSLIESYCAIGDRKSKEKLITVKISLAQLLSNRGRLDEAKKIIVETLDDCIRDFGAENDLTFKTKDALTSILLVQGHHSACMKILEEISEFHLQKSGEADDTYIYAKFTIGHILSQSRKQEDKDKGLKILRDVCKVRAKLVPSTDRTLNHMKETLATCLSVRLETSEAGKLLDEVLQARVCRYGENSKYTPNTRGCIAMNLAIGGSTKQSIKMLEDVISAQKEILGHEHQETLITLFKLAAILELIAGKQGLQRSLDLFTEVFDGRKRILGESHPYTLEAQKKMTLVSVKLERVSSTPRASANLHQNSSLSGQKVTTFTANPSISLQLPTAEGAATGCSWSSLD